MAATEAVCIKLVMAIALSLRKEIFTQSSRTPTLGEKKEEGGTSLPCATRHHGSLHAHTSVSKTGNSQLASSFVTGAQLLKISSSQTETWSFSIQYSHPVPENVALLKAQPLPISHKLSHALPQLPKAFEVHALIFAVNILTFGR